MNSLLLQTSKILFNSTARLFIEHICIKVLGTGWDEENRYEFGGLHMLMMVGPECPREEEFLVMSSIKSYEKKGNKKLLIRRWECASIRFDKTKED